MTDQELIELFVPIIEAGLTANGFTTAVVVATNQPTQEGIPSVPTVYYTKLHDKPYGFVSDEEYTDEDDNRISSSSQACETTFQIDARVTQDPSDLTIPTASDLVNFVALLMNTAITIGTLAASGIGILRVSEIGNQYFTDDRDNQEAFPSFDFTLTHTRTIATVVPVVLSVQPGIYPI